jgi:hypothetical protein
MENVDIFYDHSEYFTEIWDNVWPFGTFCVHLVHYLPVLVQCSKKNLASQLWAEMPLLAFWKTSLKNQHLFCFFRAVRLSYYDDRLKHKCLINRINVNDGDGVR